MQRTNPQILDHFYNLLIEMNFNQPDEDVFSEKNYKDDPFIQKHLQQFKLKAAKLKAQNRKNNYSSLLTEINRLRKIGFEEIRKLVNPQEAAQLQPLFRKFEELSKRDEASIAEDQEMLQLISALKEKLDNPNNE